MKVEWLDSYATGDDRKRFEELQPTHDAQTQSRLEKLRVHAFTHVHASNNETYVNVLCWLELFIKWPLISTRLEVTPRRKESSKLPALRRHMRTRDIGM